MTSLQEQKSDITKNSNFYTLRKRSYNNVNMYTLSENNLEILCKLLCKPVRVNVTRLSIPELRKMSKAKSYIDQKEPKLIEKMKQKVQNNETKKDNEVKKKKVKIKQTKGYNWQQIIKNVQSQTVSTYKMTTSYDYNLSTKQLLKSVKQPYIKLHRIDNVINKIAQSLAKVISNKCNTSKDDIKLNVSVLEPSKLFLTNSNQVESIYSTEALTCNSNINETISSSECIQNDSENSKIHENINKQNFKRKRKIIYDSDYEYDDSYNIFTKEENSPSLSNEEVENCIDKLPSTNMMPMKKMPRLETNYYDKLHNGSDKQNSNIVTENIKVFSPKLNIKENVSPKFYHDCENNDIKEGNISSYRASSCIYSKEKTAPQSLKNDSCVDARKQKLNNIATKIQIKESPLSKESLKAKYNLLKELRVYLIKLDHMKCSRNNNYSALKIEQLTKRYINSFKKSDLMDTQKSCLVENRGTDTNQNDKQPVLSKTNTFHSSLMKCSTRLSGLSNISENTIKAKKSEGGLHTKIHSSNENLSEMLLHNNSTKKITSNTQPLECMQNNVHKADFPKKLVASHNMKHVMCKINNNKQIGYKCIICNLYYENYCTLHQVSIDTQMQNNVSLNSLKEGTTVTENVQETAPHFLQMKRTESLDLSEEGSTQQITSVSDACKNSKQQESNICLEIFPTTTDLSAHIFLHKEHELQDKTDRTVKNVTFKQLITTKQLEDVRNTIVQEHNKSLIIQDSKVKEAMTTVTSTTTLSPLLPQPLIKTTTVSTNAVITDNALETNNALEKDKSPVANKNNSRRLPLYSPKSKLEIKEAEKFIKVCSCHNKSGRSENCLKIEVALFCHTCKILFRSIDCFNAHYDLFQYKICNRNRLSSIRTPSLLCVTCGIIFSSIQKLRYHLENHLCFKRNYGVNFVCKICKIIFIGIGALFYVHWSKHVQDPYWIASETRFPKNSLIQLEKQTPNMFIENYIAVAEHICHKCSILFVTKGDFKKHNSKCKAISPAINVIKNNQNINVKKSLKMQVNCTSCNDIFTEKLLFYKHVRNKHNMVSDPQFICVSLTVIKTAYICNICMEICESIADFEDHWLKHSTATVYFTCTHCTKAFCDSLNAFLNHAKIHEINMKQNLLSCTVTYKNTKFICNHCKVGFESKEGLDEHDVIHNLNQIEKSEGNEVQNQKTSRSDILKSKELITNNRKKDAVQKETNTNAFREQNNGICLVKDTIDDSRKRLINILEGSDNESEHELVIDLMKEPKEQALSDSLLNTFMVQRPIVLKNNTACSFTKNVSMEPVLQSCSSVSPKIMVSTFQTDISNSETCTNVSKNTRTLDEENRIKNSKELTPLNVQDVENNIAFNLTKDQNETIVSKDNSSSIKKQGYLRVRPLAELIEKRKPLQVCEFCGSTFKLPEKFIEHLSIHSMLNKYKTQSESSHVILQNPIVSEKRMITPTTLAISNQQSQHIQTCINQSEHPVSILSSVSAYHKNLPVCNITRTTKACSIKESKNASINTVASFSNEPNQRAKYTIPTFLNKGLPAVCVDNMKNSTQSDSFGSSLQVRMKMSNTNCVYKGQPVWSTAVTRDTGLNNYENNSEILQHNQQIVVDDPVTGNISTIYNTNPTTYAGGMAIVINRSIPAVQNISTINIIGQEQREIYPPQINVDPTVLLDHPYVQQIQDLQNGPASTMFVKK